MNPDNVISLCVTFVICCVIGSCLYTSVNEDKAKIEMAKLGYVEKVVKPEHYAAFKIWTKPDCTNNFEDVK